MVLTERSRYREHRISSAMGRRRRSHRAVTSTRSSTDLERLSRRGPLVCSLRGGIRFCGFIVCWWLLSAVWTQPTSYLVLLPQLHFHVDLYSFHFTVVNPFLVVRIWFIAWLNICFLSVSIVVLIMEEISEVISAAVVRMVNFSVSV